VAEAMTDPVVPPVRSPIERQLNVGLMVIQVIAALIVVYGVAFVVVSWNGEDRPRSEAVQLAVVFLLLPGVVVFFTARSARRRLKEQAVGARLFSILAGVFALLAALPLLRTAFGAVCAVAGLFTVAAGFLLRKDVLR
jgi:small-conductance mechanosensitive channel